MKARKKRSHWKPPSLEVGDRVRHMAKDCFGFIHKINGDTLTVDIAGKLEAVDKAGVVYVPTREKVDAMKRLIRKSALRSQKELRKKLGLPPSARRENAR